MPQKGVQYQVHGLDELIRDFRKVNREIPRELNRRLRRVAEPVRQEVRNELAEKDSSSRTRAGVTIRIRRGSTVTVEQARSKTTGTRPDWGFIQQTRDFEPALDTKQPEVLRGLEEFVDDIADTIERGGRRL